MDGRDDEAAERRLAQLLCGLATCNDAAAAAAAEGWRQREVLLEEAARLAAAHPREAEEALLAVGPAAVADAALAAMVSGRTARAGKLAAADLLASACAGERTQLLLSPSAVVERLMRAAAFRDADVRAAAARALWQLACGDFASLEVVSHAGSAFRVVDVLAEDMQGGGGGGRACLRALLATQQLLRAYLSAGGPGAGAEGLEHIGGRIIQPLCSLLDPQQAEAAGAAAELLSMLSQSAGCRARIAAAGGVQRLVALVQAGGAGGGSGGGVVRRPRGSDSSGDGPQEGDDPAAALPPVVPPQQQQQQEEEEEEEQQQQQAAAARAALSALSQLARGGDGKLACELLGARVVPALLKLLGGHPDADCCAGALALLGDLAVLPDGRRALQFAGGLRALAEAAPVCPEQQLCRLLSKATGRPEAGAPAPDLSGLLDSSSLVELLVRCCRPEEPKTCKRALQVLARLCEQARASGGAQHAKLQSQLLSLGLLRQVRAVLALQQLRVAHAAAGQPGAAAGGSMLQVQLAIALLQEVAASPAIFAAAHVAPAPSKREAAAPAPAVPDQDSRERPDQHRKQQQQQQQQQQPAAAVSQLSSQLAEAAAAGASGRAAASIARAVIADTSLAWRHPAAAAAAFGDLVQLLPGDDGGGGGAERHGAAAPGSSAAGLQDLEELLWLLQQLLLSPAHQLPSLQQSVLQTVLLLAAHRRQELLDLMTRQGWVQLLWSCLPGGRQLLAVVLSQLLQQQERGHAAGPSGQPAAAPGGAPAPAASPRPGLPPPLLPSALSNAAVDAASPRKGGLQPHLLQLLDEALPTLEQTAVALQALAHMCSSSAAAEVVAQLQAGYEAASATGMLAARAPPFGAAAGSVLLLAPHSGTPNPAAAVVAATLGGGNSPRAPGARALAATPPSLASSGTSGILGSSATASCGVPAAAPSSSSSSSSSSSLGASVVSGGGVGGLVRSASSGLLSRLGMSSRGGGPAAVPRHDGSCAGDAKTPTAAGAAAAAAAAAAASVFSPAVAAAAAASGVPVEDPGSPVQMLSTLLGEQWAATAAAELLARLAARRAACLPAMVEHGVVQALAGVMAEVQDTAPGAVAAVATLHLAEQLGGFCPERLHAAGVPALVLRMLRFECAAAGVLVRSAGLRALLALCEHSDRPLCAAVAQAALLPLVRLLQHGSPEQAGQAASVLASLLNSGAVDGAVLSAQERHAPELLAACLGCLPRRRQQQQQQQQQQWQPEPGADGLRHCQGDVELTAVRLVRAFVQLDGSMMAALLEADGLADVLSMLSAAVEATCRAGGAGAGSGAGSGAGDEPGQALVLQHELLVVLDSLSLAHRRALIQAPVIPLIGRVLSQRRGEHADAGPGGGAAAQPPAAAAAAAAAGAEPAAAAPPAPPAHGAGAARGLSRSSSRAPGAAAGPPSSRMGAAELLLRCKVVASQLILVLAIRNDVKRQLFHGDAVGSLMRLAEEVEEGSGAQEAVRAALAQLGLAYLMPPPSAAAAAAAAAEGSGL